MKLDDFFQISPSQPPSSTAYNTSLADLGASLSASGTKWPPAYQQAASPYPFYTPPQRLAELHQVQSALHTAVVAIIKNWWSTPRYQVTIPISPKVERVLRSLELRRPYTDIGSYRPDYLIPLHHHQPLAICEINARFMFNGFFAGAYIQKYVDKLEFGDSLKGLKGSTDKDVGTSLEYLGICIKAYHRSELK